MQNTKQHFVLSINGTKHEITCAPDRLLIDVLREDLRLTGTKRGCGIGACGACTVLIDGKVKKACRVGIMQISRDSGLGTRDAGDLNCRVPEVTTIEGLSQGNTLHPIQQAFIDCGAIQCGFCTPGMVLAAKALLDENPSPSREEIKKALAGNLCRCTGYQQIFEAIEEAAKMSGESNNDDTV